MAGTLTVKASLEYDAGYTGTLAHASDQRPILNLEFLDQVYTNKSVLDLTYSGAVTDEDIFAGTASSAKVVLVRSTLHGGDLKINGGTAIPVSEGAGWVLFVNPAGGITSLTLTTTDAANFDVHIFS